MNMTYFDDYWAGGAYKRAEAQRNVQVFLDWLKEHDPEMYERIKEKMKEE